MEEWKTYKLGDLCNIHRGASPRPIQKFLSDKGQPWVKISDATSDSSRFISTTKEFIIEDGIKHSVIVTPGTLIVSNSATPGLPKIMKIEACVHDGWLIIDQIRDCVLKEYLYYSFINIRRNLSNQANGSVFQNLKTEIVKNFEIKIPSLSKQRLIVDVLSSIEDKIDLNNRINHNLEEQAQALYKSWFVDFEPFQEGEFVESELGLIPKGWKVVSLDSLCSIISRGFSPKYSESTTDVVLGQRCVRNNMIDLSVSKTHVPKNLGERALCQYDILINSTGMGSLGRVAQIYFKPERMTYDSHLTLVRAKSSTLEMYLGRNLLSRQDEIENMAVGSTGQTELPRDSVKAMSILLPCDTVLDQFGALIRAIAGRIQSNLEENVGLTAMRDYLLPKLMSGELKINDLDC